MRKGLIILGGQGVGKTRLAESIAAMYKTKDVGYFEECDAWLFSDKKINIIDGVSTRTHIPLLIRKPYSSESNPLQSHRFILVSNCLKEKDIPKKYLKMFNVITLKQ